MNWVDFLNAGLNFNLPAVMNARVQGPSLGKCCIKSSL